MIKPVATVVDDGFADIEIGAMSSLKLGDKLYALQEGYAIVPIEPTEAMYVGGMAYLHKRGTAWAVNDLYKAMIAAYKEEQ